MRYSATVARLGIIAGLLVLPGLSWATPVVANSTQVEVRICAGPSTASMVVEAPISDSTVDTKTIQVTGQIVDVSQIVLHVNGAYNSTTAIGSSQTSFSIDVTLSEGTNTLMLEAIDVCNVENPVESLVVTYQPAQPPSQGGETPTETDPGIKPEQPSSGGGVRVGIDDNGQSVDGVDGSAGLASWLRDVVRITDFDTLRRGDIGLNILRLIAVLSGLFMMIGASGVVGLLARWRQGEVKTWQLIGVQLAGLTLLILALVVF